MLGGIAGEFRALIDEGPHGAFEQTVERVLGDRVRSNIWVARALWCALANVDWTHPDHGEVGYSFRAAGDLVAAIRKEGDYMDWYCCGRDGTVDEIISDALEPEGWTFEVCR